MDPSSYLSKCSHFVLYITLIGVTFLGGMHFIAPIYGFAAYRFIATELTCSLDHHAHFACPYALYTLLLVQGPIYFPLIYWTVYFSFERGSSYNQSQNSINFGTSKTLLVNKSSKLESSIAHSKSSFLFVFCCTKNLHNSSESFTPSSQAHSVKESNKCKKSVNKPNSSDPVIFSTASTSSSSRLTQKQIKSNLLTSSNEVSTVLITAWLFLCSYTAKLLHNSFLACHAPSSYPTMTEEMPNLPQISVATPANDAERKITFYTTFADETVSCVILPIILILFHLKLRYSLNLIFKCLFYICCHLFSKKHRQSSSFTVQTLKHPDLKTSMKKSHSFEHNSRTHEITPTLNQSINSKVNFYNSDIEMTVV